MHEAAETNKKHTEIQKNKESKNVLSTVEVKFASVENVQVRKHGELS